MTEVPTHSLSLCNFSVNYLSLSIVPFLKCHAITWLRQYATTWRVIGLIPDDVIGFFNSCNLSSCIMIEQKGIPGIFLGVKGILHLRPAASLSMSCLSRKYENFNVS